MRLAAASATYVLKRKPHWKHAANVDFGNRNSGCASHDSAIPASVNAIAMITMRPASRSDSGDVASERNSNAGKSTK
jgi:hypothetical protein